MKNEIRLQKWLADAGVASRRKAEEIILEGRVAVNGIVAQLGTKANTTTDVVTVDGKSIEIAQEKIYIMLHKPEGVVTTVTDPFSRSTVMDFISEEITARLYPVGRLDYDTSGLLLMTNDGEWAQKLTHPKHEVKKTYIAIVKGIPTASALKKFKEGLVIDGKKTSRCDIKQESVVKGNAKLRITIHEGRNRQVRRMCEAIGHDVISLKRVAIGELKLNELGRGKWRHLTRQEVKGCITKY